MAQARAVRRRVEVELRQIFEADDFGEQLTPEMRDSPARMREQLETQN